MGQQPSWLIYALGEDWSDWEDEAACLGVDPALFVFTIRRGQTARTTPDVGRAKRVCAGCPVREPCLEAALAHPALRGIWGGTDDQERRRLRRRLKIRQEHDRGS